MIKNKINNTKNILVLVLKRFYKILSVPLFAIKNRYLFIGISLSLAVITAYTNYKLAYNLVTLYTDGESGPSLDLYSLIYLFVLGSLCYVNIYLVFNILQRIKNMITQYAAKQPWVQGRTNCPSLILNDNNNNNNNNKNNKPNNKGYWKYILLFILCFTITNILHFLGYNDITDLISVYKIGLIINLLFCNIIIYNSIAMYLVNFNPQRQIEKYKIYKYLPKSTKNFFSLYDTNHPELIKAINKLLIGGIVISILIMVIINVVLLFI